MSVIDIKTGDNRWIRAGRNRNPEFKIPHCRADSVQGQEFIDQCKLLKDMIGLLGQGEHSIEVYWGHRTVKHAIRWPSIDLNGRGTDLAALMNFASFLDHVNLVAACASTILEALRSNSKHMQQMSLRSVERLNLPEKLILLDLADIGSFKILERVIRPPESIYKAAVSRMLQRNSFVESIMEEEESSRTGQTFPDDDRWKVIFRRLATFQDDVGMHDKYERIWSKLPIRRGARFGFSPDCRYLFARISPQQPIARLDLVDGALLHLPKLPSYEHFLIPRHNQILLFSFFHPGGTTCDQFSMDTLRPEAFRSFERNVAPWQAKDDLMTGRPFLRSKSIVYSTQDITSGLEMDGLVLLCERNRYATIDKETKNLEIWDYRTGRCLFKMETGWTTSTSRLLAVQISAADELVVAAFDTHITACYTKDHRVIRFYNSLKDYGALITPDCSFVILHRRNLEDQSVTRVVEIEGYNFMVRCDIHCVPCAVSPDSRFVVTLHEIDGDEETVNLKLLDLTKTRGVKFQGCSCVLCIWRDLFAKLFRLDQILGRMLSD